MSRFKQNVLFLFYAYSVIKGLFRASVADELSGPASAGAQRGGPFSLSRENEASRLTKICIRQLKIELGSEGSRIADDQENSLMIIPISDRGAAGGDGCVA